MLIGEALQGSAYDEQIRLETEAVAEGVRRYRAMVEQAMKRDAAASLPPAAKIISRWFPAMVSSIKVLQRLIKRPGPKAQIGKGADVWAPVIAMVDADTLAAITLNFTFNELLTCPAGIRRTVLARIIGNAVFAEIHANVLKSERQEDWKKLVDFAKRITPARVNKLARSFDLEDGLHTIHAEIHVGWRLLVSMLDIATLWIGDGEDAKEVAGLVLTHMRTRTGGGRVGKVGIVRLTDDCLALVGNGLTLRESLRPLYLPMVVEPVAWEQNLANRGVSGGYVRIRSPLVTKSTTLQRRRLRSAPSMERVYDAINVLNRTRWRINRRVLDVAKQLSKAGSVLDLPPAEDLTIPRRPPGLTDEQHREWRHTAATIYRQNIGIKGERRRLNLTLAIADRLADRPMIWFPHQLDYRGRAYPIPSHLNHQRSDLTRGLLEFADKAPLGQHGSFWLHVSVANAFGIDKVPFAERVDWVNQHRSEIHRVTSDPIKNTWWHQADEPWQFLAACYALEDGSGNACVRVDGACNGLQHYAALARDSGLAAAVCLAPADRPADIYTACLEIVKAKVYADAREGYVNAVRALPLLTRKVVKQPVMTYTYNVTRHGAAAQIAEQLADGLPNVRERYATAQYLTKLVLDSVGQLGPAAKNILDWLLGCARTMMAAENARPIEWTTPLGFPVFQPQQKHPSIAIECVRHNIKLAQHAETSPPKKGKQVDAIGPNLIHSLDATHMMLTALEAGHAGMPFAAVHDSFWTTAGHMPALSGTIRRTFVDLHSHDVLADWRQQQVSRTGIELPQPPERGSFDINSVLSSLYFFA